MPRISKKDVENVVDELMQINGVEGVGLIKLDSHGLEIPVYLTPKPGCKELTPADYGLPTTLLGKPVTYTPEFIGPVELAAKEQTPVASEHSGY